jgi:soluble lytic murein transglycosylase-like protein
MLFAARSFRASVALLLCLGPALPCRAETVPAIVVPTSAYASAIRAINPHLRASQSRVFADALLVNSRRNHVDPRLVMAVVTVESHWNSRAVSIHGAEGLGQLKPGTARELGVDPWSARGNLRGITLYLHRLLSLFKTSRQAMREAIAGYNAGPYAVAQAGGIPSRPETQRYVGKVIAELHAFKSRLSADPGAAAVANELDVAQIFDENQTAYWGAR